MGVLPCPYLAPSGHECLCLSCALTSIHGCASMRMHTKRYPPLISCARARYEEHRGRLALCTQHYTYLIYRFRFQMQWISYFSTYPVPVWCNRVRREYPALELCGAAIRLAGVEMRKQRHFRFTDKTARAHSFPEPIHHTCTHVVDAKRLDEFTASCSYFTSHE